MSELRSSGSTRRWRAIRTAVLERDGYACYWCGKPADTVDHLQPRAAGGGDELWNLAAACAKCNYGRGNQSASRAAPSRSW